MDHIIEINLLPGPRKKKKRSGGGPSFSLPDFGDLIGRIKDPLMLGLIGAWVVSLAVIAGVFFAYNGVTEALEPERDQLRREKNRYQRELTLARQADVLLDSLEAELEFIRRIDADRYTWPHILDELARALPDYTWFNSVDLVATVPAGGVEDAEQVDTPPTVVVEARTSEINQATTFVRRLAESPWFTDVELGRTQAGIEQDRSVIYFTVELTFQTADSAFIRTVPVTGEAQ
jgi:Tfp pilus assembly protein PilN